MTKLFVSLRPFTLCLLLLSILRMEAVHAQTSGPISPEAASFEPFDMTDIVNLATGDFVYNLPLFEVPGPGGGYPISLSYHAGIMPSEEASWVGLGWSLNPGAINRTVNGYPDDYYNVKSTTRQFWSGGSITTKAYSVNVGFTGIFTVNAGMVVSRDTYMGVGRAMTGGFTLGLKQGNLQLGASVQVAGNPYGGGAQMSVGANAGIGLGNGSSAGVGINYSNTNGLSGSVGISGGFTSVGVSISSSGLHTSFSVAGFSGSSNVSNSRAGNISTYTESSGYTIPLYFVSYSFQKETTRYWIDEIDEVTVNGLLHLNTTDINDLPEDYFDDHEYDVYTAMAIDSQEAFELEPNGDYTRGGSYPDYDEYQVLGQGLSGNMRPYIFQAHLNKRNDFHLDNDNERTDYVKQSPLGSNDNTKTHFRFINDFSNHELNELHSWDWSSGTPSYEFNPLDDRYGFRNHQLAGSRHVEHYTNQEILDGIPNFLEANATGFNRSELKELEQIGAFSITNESGVTYHYSLPAYSRDEYLFSKKKDEDKGLHYNEFEKREPYAYTWHLTAMTGPDYVDRGSPGIDAEDWGYWVEFEYGKWTEHFAWRNPGQGFNTDLDQEFENYSEGQKEVYYLDAIRTKSHTAYFIKDIRKDAKSNTYLIKNRIYGVPKLYQNKYYEGGFEEYIPDKEPYCWGKRENGSTIIGRLKQYKVRPMNSLKLAKIILVENNSGPYSDPVDKSNGMEWHLYNGGYWDQEPDETITGCDFSPLRINYHLYQNVLDVYDLERMEEEGGLTDRSIKSIEFVTDYSLVPNTPSSSKGKLTLKALESFGIKGASYMPPTRFAYEDRVDLPVKSTMGITPGSLDQSLFFINVQDYDNDNVTEFLDRVKPGEIIKFTRDAKYRYGVISSIDKSQKRIHGKVIDRMPLGNGVSTQMHLTKNPPYDKDAIDQWGYFKSDFDFGRIGGNETLTRRPTEISAQSTDVWSLRNITSNLGSTVSVEYESDVYEEAAMAESSILRISSVDPLNDGSLEIKVGILNDGGNLDEMIETNDFVDVSVTVKYRLFVPDIFDNDGNLLRQSCDCDSGFDEGKLARIERASHIAYKTYTIHNVSVKAINTIDNEITIRSSLLTTDLVKNNFVISWDESGACDEKLTCSYSVLAEEKLIAGGVVKVPFRPTKGGGLRTKSVTLSSDSYSNKTSYVYEDGTTSFEPIGIVQPHFLEDFQEYVDHEEDTSFVNRANRTIKRSIIEGAQKIFVNSREIVPPAVMYKSVEVRDSVIHENGEVYGVPGMSKYHYQTFDKSLVDFEEVAPIEASGTLPDGKEFTLVSAIVKLKDFTSRVGVLNKVTHYGPDPENDENLIKLDESQYHYLHDGMDTFDENCDDYIPKIADYENIGITREVFTNRRIVNAGKFFIYLPIFDKEIESGYEYDMFAVVSTRENYPTFKIGETHTNFKTGLKTSTFIRKYDHFTGVPIEAISSDSYGNYYLKETDLAYHKYDELGLIVENPASNKNMLTQVAGDRTWRIAAPADLFDLPGSSLVKEGLVNANVQTWAKDIETLYVSDAEDNRWRKKSQYSWVGDDDPLTTDGLYPHLGFEAFDYNNESNNSQWQKNSEITKYDYYSHALEAVDINGSYAASKMDSDHFRVLSTATNAAYDEFIFTGGEDRQVWVSTGQYKFGGDVFRRDASLIINQPNTVHTGNRSFIIPKDGKEGIKYEWTPKKDHAHTYKISLWLYAGSPNKVIIRYNNVQADGSIQYENHDLIKNESRRSGDWYLVEGYITADNTRKRSITVMHDQSSTANTIIDDFRMQPVGSSMTSYVYDEFGRVTDILDNNNLSTHFEYNAVGQLTSVTKETFQYGAVKTQEIEYNYTEK